MRGFVCALALLTLIRLVVAASVPLAPDEAYYWTWSHALAAGYIDHPPVVALAIKLGTLLAGQTTLGVRLLGPLAAALASWMLWDATRILFPDRQALVAPTLLNASLLLGVGSVIMTPDSPLLFFWTATLWAVAHLAAGRAGVWWLVAGVFGGLALDSKYTALLLWAGGGAWVLLVPSVRFWLRRWQPWAACIIGLSLFAPVLAWNATHGWAGFARQGGRVGDWRPARAVQFIAELIGGQIGLATPLVWALCLGALVVTIRQARRRDPGWSLLLALSLLPLLVFVQHALGDRVQGNWPAIIYPALAVAVAGWGPPRRWWIAASGLGFAITALAYLQATLGLLPLPAGLDPIAVRLEGWRNAAVQVNDAARALDAAYVAVDGYGPASEMAWWMPADAHLVGVDDRWRLTTLPRVAIVGDGLLVREARYAGPPDPALWANARRVGLVPRPQAPGHDLALWHVTASHGPVEVAALPAR